MYGTRVKKRKKNASALHEATYKSSKMRRSNKELYKWDPRAVQYRNKTDKLLLHEFIVNLQSGSADNNEGEMSMWESSLRFEYTDFKIDYTDKLCIQSLVEQFQSGLEEDILKTTMVRHNASTYSRIFYNEGSTHSSACYTLKLTGIEWYNMSSD